MSTDSDQSKNIFFKDDNIVLDLECEWSFSAEFDAFMADEDVDDDDDEVDEDSKEWSFFPDGSQ